MSEGCCAMVNSRVLLHIFPLGESFLRGGNFTNGRYESMGAYFEKCPKKPHVHLTTVSNGLS